MKINVLGILKGVTEMAVSSGTGVVVGNLVRATTPDDLTKMQKVMVGIGAYSFGAVIGDLSAKYISAQIDDYAARAKRILNPEEDFISTEPDGDPDVSDAKVKPKEGKKNPEPEDSE